MERIEIEINLPDDVQEIMSVIREYGATSYVVGGCVRDSIIGREPHDWDICTSASPAQVKQIFNEKPYTVVPAGAKHGTVMVIAHRMRTVANADKIVVLDDGKVRVYLKTQKRPKKC